MEPHLAELTTPCVPVSWGELLDKLTILEIKRERIVRADARENVVREHSALAQVASDVIGDPEVGALFGRLKAVNEALWTIEDSIREEEAKGAFGATFIALARSVYFKNDDRAALKREINVRLRSELVEEKSYADPRGVAA